MAVELYPHQSKALAEIHNGCILKGDVGTGKSITALAYYYTRILGGTLRVNGVGESSEPVRAVKLYIITTAKKRDDYEWEKDAAAFGISPDSEVSVGGTELVVDSWNNITQYADVEGAFFIFDEQRLVGSGAWVKAFIKIARANRWILLSATPGDSWMDYVPVFVARGYYKNRTEFIRRHVVYRNFSKYPRIDRYVEEGHLNALRRQVLVEMPYERHTIRHAEDIVVGFDQGIFDRVWKDRWNVYEDEPIQDIAEMFRVARKVVNSDPSRLNGVMRTWEKHPRLIIFYNFNYELELLRTLGATLNVEVAEWNGHKHQPVPEGDKWLYLVQYTAGSEGWNCITTNAIFFYSLNYSYKVRQQSHGRIDRLNTPFRDLYYYTARTNSAIDRAILKALKTKKNFNEKTYSKDWQPFPSSTGDETAEGTADAYSALENKYSSIPQIGRDRSGSVAA